MNVFLVILKLVMNNRIRELATEVGMSVEYLDNTKQWVLIEALAELIINETLQVAKVGMEFGPSMDEAVHRYFGVK